MYMMIKCCRFSRHFSGLTLSLQPVTFCRPPSVPEMSGQSADMRTRTTGCASEMVFFFFLACNLRHKWDSGRRNTCWVWLLMASDASDITSSRHLGLLDSGAFIFGFAGSHDDGWHFLLLGTMNALPWPPSLPLSPSRGFLFLPLPPFLGIVAPASNLRLPPSLSLSRQAHFL